MPFIEGDVSVAQINEIKWKLLEPVIYKGSTQTFTVPVGFITDFASVPRIFFWLLPSYGAYTKAAILHDFLYDTKMVSRADADGIFRRAMRELGVAFIRRWIMWAAVRTSGYLKGAKLADVAAWILITVPSVIFLLIPAVVIIVWLKLFWFIELLFFLLLKPLSHSKRVNPPPTT